MKISHHAKVLAASCAAIVLAVSGLSACGNAQDASDSDGSISYWLWDANQKPSYEKCAAAFEHQHPDLRVTITQYGWDDYWSNITNAFVAGTAPDVFTNHLARYPEFIEQEQLVQLDEHMTIRSDDFQEGLADLWIGPDGHNYGMPKDFDTTGVFYNVDKLEEAGITREQVQNLTWNPDDGGELEQVAARLSVDKNGRHGDEPGFDKNNVSVYGLALGFGSGNAVGQTQYAALAGSLGWRNTDVNPWGNRYNFDDERFQSTIAWERKMIEKGYLPTIEGTKGQSTADVFAAKKIAMVTEGSWLTNQFFGYDGINVGLAPNPIGPEGKRSSMYNGLGDSIWSGSKNIANAVAWVEFLGSEECQTLVGEDAVVFPASPAGTEKAIESWKAKGIDVSPFTMHIDDGTAFLYPITNDISKIDAIMASALDAVLMGKQKVSSLNAANDEINAILAESASRKS
ncbi:MAG: sugar ABC transporter substrate-binding protein [Bifidobacterium psychraerophilum]|uniref:ABC transporter substrate-binding protein n=1 Tax=Bifidobacterium psychraerophilum TaxID=218140 RepID=UPI0039ECF7D8